RARDSRTGSTSPRSGDPRPAQGPCAVQSQCWKRHTHCTVGFVMEHAPSGAAGICIADYWLHEQLPARPTQVAYRATHRVLPRTARVAILKPENVGVRHAEIQLMREACVVETLHHGGVPRVYECGVIDRRPWVATEQILGISIEEAAARRP